MTIVGSYPQPDWLIDRERLKASLPPRVRAETLWRVPEPWLADAQEAATLMAIRDQEELGIDIIGDGEMRRESYKSEEHPPELQSLTRISYAVYCLQKKKPDDHNTSEPHQYDIKRQIIILYQLI